MLRIYYNSAKAPELLQLEEPRDGAWLYLESPTEEELHQLAERYKLDIDLLHDGVDPNESPRIERDGDSVYIFSRYCLPVSEKQTTSPLLIIYAKGVVITISRHEFAGVESLTSTIGIVTSKRAQLVLQLLSEINGGYKRRINQAGRRIWEIRAQLNKDQIDNKDFISFIDIEEDLNDFLLVLEPMDSLLNTLLNGRFMRLYEEDRDLIEDLSLGTQELTQLAESRLGTLRNIREAYSTITANNLNKIFKLMTSITILMSIFSTITGIYSMNVYVPYQNRRTAAWVIIGVTLGLIGIAAYFFKRKKWF
jgi:magnesium transporter